MESIALKAFYMQESGLAGRGFADSMMNQMAEEMARRTDAEIMRHMNAVWSYTPHKIPLDERLEAAPIEEKEEWIREFEIKLPAKKLRAIKL